MADKSKLDVIKIPLTPALVAANTTAEQSFNTVVGVAVGDLVLVFKPTAQAGLAVVSSGRVTALNTVAITFINDTAAGITPTAGETYTFLVVRGDG